MKSGIYKITNTVNGKFYIGSAYQITRRINKHKHHLRNGDHVNKHLQAAWSKYGEDAFVFETLVLCGVPDLLQVEQSYIDQLKPVELGYNICPVAGSTMKGRKFTPEHKAKLSAANKGQVNPHKGVPRSEETKKRIALANKGRPNRYKGVPRSPETRLKISMARTNPKAQQTLLQNVDCSSGTVLHQ